MKAINDSILATLYTPDLDTELVQVLSKHWLVLVSADGEQVKIELTKKR